MENNKINLEEWEAAKVTGGFTDGLGNEYLTVTGTTHYLAFRTEPDYDERNEIGKLFNGEIVQIAGGRYQGRDGRIYLYVYAPKFGRYGFVNENYVIR